MNMKKLAMTLILIAAVGPATAAEMPGHNMEGMKMDQAPAKAAVNKATGEVKGLDAAKGTVTLAHGPVPALKWPAMTMPFRISPALAKDLKVGQKVDFEFTARDMDGTITKIASAK
jgi:Cu(I)/Ag(I) efflux system protein CusF